MGGFPLQSREEMESGLDALREEEEHRAAVSSAFAKIDKKVRSVRAFCKPDEVMLMKITWAELKALRMFGRKFHND